MRERIEQAMRRRILVLDGAMGTMIQQQNLTEDDFGGREFDGCNEYLTMTRPDVIASIHRAYLEAGADILETNTFGATPLVLAEYGLAHLARELNRRAAVLARETADRFSTADRPRFVAGSMGPTTKNLSVTGGMTFDALAEAYYVQALGLVEGGVDLLLLETSQDLLNVKAASLGIRAGAKPNSVQACPSWSPARSNRWAPRWPGRRSRRSISRSNTWRPSRSASTVRPVRNLCAITSAPSRPSAALA